ncbi:MAG: tungstate transporter permease, partial [Deltaproteobacteria bacterium]|nr:tungstate transporter permease [Deltaproteobacteria bacterium]
FEVAIALSVILLVLAFGINAVLTRVQQRERPR